MKDAMELLSYDSEYVKQVLKVMKHYEHIGVLHPASKSARGTVVSARNSKTHPKIQRNEPCPCGSGLKYKKCCITFIEKEP